MHRRSLAALAATLCALALAPPAALAADVTVRVEGQDRTLLEPRQVATTGQAAAPVPVGTAAEAIDLATGGNWDRLCFTSTLLGESHTFAANDYWAFWINGRFSSTQGICDYQVGDGDQVLMLVDVADASFNPTVRPLELRDVPAAVEPGRPVVVSAVRRDFDGTAAPEPGVTVSSGAVTAVSDTEGRAALTLQDPGAVTFVATKPGFARSAPAGSCVGCAPATTAAPAAGAPADAAAASPAAPYEPPHAQVAGLRAGQRIAVRRAPRTLRGTVDLGTSPLLAVKLRLLRRSGSACEYWSGGLDRFRRARCGGGYFFKTGSEAEWSYLFPQRLPAGRYALDVAVSDTDHGRTVQTTGFVVR